jgi:hypothetical protein
MLLDVRHHRETSSVAELVLAGKTPLPLPAAFFFGWRKKSPKKVAFTISRS